MCIAVCCSVLHCSTECCRVLQSVAECCKVQSHDRCETSQPFSSRLLLRRLAAFRYRVLQCVAVCCSVLQCVAVCCNVLQSVAKCKIVTDVTHFKLQVSITEYSLFYRALLQMRPMFITDVIHLNDASLYYSPGGLQTFAGVCCSVL